MDMKMHMNHGGNRVYLRLFVMTILSFALMYLLMYAMVDTFANVFPNFNQFYMAGLMASPMILLELILMKPMYGNRQLNVILIVASLILMGLFWNGIRGQVAIDDKQFLKSMIPHHGGAILMCENASLQDAQIRELCRNILKGQQAEIDFMKAKLNSLQ